VEEMGFDGIDINMGCPEKNVVKRGACAGLIHNHRLVTEIINAVREGSKLPLSVKTRIGIAEAEIEEWVPFLLSKNLDALTVHLRTVREMSHVPAHWEQASKIVKLRDELSPSTLIIGNGDVVDLKDAKTKIKDHKLDGVMIGRGIFHDPYLFNNTTKLDELDFDERMKLLLFHSELFEQEWGNNKHFAILRKFYKIYTHGLPNASEMREKLMTTKNLSQVKKAIINI